MTVADYDKKILEQESDRKRIYDEVKDFTAADSIKTDRAMSKLAEIKSEIDRLMVARKKSQYDEGVEEFKKRKEAFLAQ